MSHSMDWNRELQDLVLDLQAAALAIELFRLAFFRGAPPCAQFPPEVQREYLSRFGALLSQRAADLGIWGQCLAGAGPVSPSGPTAPG